MEKTAKDKLPHCTGCMRPDGFNGETHQYGTVEHPESAALHESVARPEQVCANPSCGHSESTHNDGFGGCTARYYPEDSDNPNSQCICDRFQKAQSEPERDESPEKLIRSALDNLYRHNKQESESSHPSVGRVEIVAAQVKLSAALGKLAPSPLPVREHRLLDAINWAMGCGEGFIVPEDAASRRYWWREGLAKRAGLVYDGQKYIAGEKEE